MPKNTPEPTLEEKWIDFLRKEYHAAMLSAAGKEEGVVIDYKLLDKYDPKLADALLERPDEVLDAAIDAVSQIDLPTENAKISLEFENLPESACVRIKDLRAKHIGKFITVDGMIKSASYVRPEAAYVIYECPACKQEMKVPQIRRGNRLAKPHMCSNPTCGRQGRFILKSKTLVDGRRVKLQEPPEELSGGGKPSQLYTHLLDNLTTPTEVKKTTPGNRVKISGVLREMPVFTSKGAVTTRSDIYMTANHVEPVQVEFEDIKLTKKDIDKIKKLAKSTDVYEKLTDSIAPSIYGMRDVKEAILLQLFGGVWKEKQDKTTFRGDIHLLITGDPAVAKSTIISYVVTQLTPKGRYASGKKTSGVGLTSAVVKDEFTGGWILEAGAVVLANGDICAIDEFDKMMPEDRDALLESMEKGTVTVTKAGISTTMRADTSILAAANPKFERFDNYLPLAEQIELGPTMLSRFDLKFPVFDIPNAEKDRRMARHIIDSSLNKGKTAVPPISPDIIKKYLAYAKKNCKPKIDQKAMQQIEDFYVSWRTKYQDVDGKDKTVTLTPRQLEALIRLTEASAKIRLADTAISKDVKRATGLLETSLEAFGLDPDTGKIDIDRINATVTAHQRDEIHTLLTILQKLKDEVGNKIPVDDVIIEAKTHGISDVDVVRLLEKLKEKGDIFAIRDDMIGFV